MSRAEGRALPPPPRLTRVLRVAAEDVYYNGVRLVVANVVWGVAALVSAFAVTRGPIGLLALVPMVPLTIGLMGMAVALVRDGHVVMSDFTRAIADGSWRLVVVGIAQIGVTLVATFNLVLGFQLGGPFGVVLATVAAYTILGIWVLAVTTWPILTDPERRAEPVGTRLRLGALLTVAHPVRVLALAALLAILGIVASILVAAIATFAAAYLALVAAHYVLPAADRLEGRQTRLVEPDEPNGAAVGAEGGPGRLGS